MGIKTGNIPDPTECAPVTYSPPAGTYGTPQTVALSTETAGASIYYTVDGIDPIASNFIGVTVCTRPVGASRTCHIDIGGVILSGMFGGPLLKSLDNGVTWTSIPTSPTLYWRSITKHGSTLYATSTSGVRSSSDSGLTWSSIANPPGWINDYYSTIMPEDDTLAIFYMTATGVRKSISVDGGTTWGSALVVTASAVGQRVCVAPDGAYYTGNGENIRKSTDKGLNWSVVYTKTGAQFRIGGSFLPDGSILWVEEDGYLHRSADDGATFSEVTEYGSRDWMGPSDHTSASIVIGTWSATRFLVAGTSVVGELYTAPLTISESTTVKAIAVKAGLDDSAVTSALYTILPPYPPRAYPPPGTYQGVQLVSLKSSQSLPIRYTLDGSDPTPSSPLYTGPIPVYQDTQIKAAAFSGTLSSDILTLDYKITNGLLPKITSYRDRVLPYLLEQYKGDNP